MHMNMDITRFLVEGREEQYLRHFFRDFAYNPAAIPERKCSSTSRRCVSRETSAEASTTTATFRRWQHRPPNSRRPSYRADAGVGGPGLLRRPLLRQCQGDRRIAEGGVIEECGHWVFEEQPDFIRQELERFWTNHS